MCQRNNVYKTERSVTRRPADLVTKENMKEIAQKYVMVQNCTFLGGVMQNIQAKLWQKENWALKGRTIFLKTQQTS